MPAETGPNPWGVAVLGERLFVVDASLNSLIAVDLASHAVRTLTTFAALPNTRGTGPSVVEAVPDGIRVYGNQLLVTLLTGSPYPDGGAQVRVVDPDTGANAPFITGLTSAIDALPLPGGGFLTLEYSADMLAGAAASRSGRLQLFAAPDTAPIVVANNFSTPTGLALDPRSGSVFISEISTGRIVKVPPWSAVAAVTLAPFLNLSVRGNAGVGNETLIAGFSIGPTAKQVLLWTRSPMVLRSVGTSVRTRCKTPGPATVIFLSQKANITSRGCPQPAARKHCGRPATCSRSRR